MSKIFAPLGYDNVHTRVGDGYYGWPEVQGGFDIIIVTCAAQYAPPDLFKQMKPGGRMVIPDRPAVQARPGAVRLHQGRGGQDPLQARHGRVLHPDDRRDPEDAAGEGGLAAIAAAPDHDIRVMLNSGPPPLPCVSSVVRRAMYNSRYPGRVTPSIVAFRKIHYDLVPISKWHYICSSHS